MKLWKIDEEKVLIWWWQLCWAVDISDWHWVKITHMQWSTSTLYCIQHALIYSNPFILFSLFILIHGINFTFSFITGDLYPRLIPQYYIPQGNFCPPCPEGKLGKVVGRLQESINPQFKTWFGENQNVRWSLTTGQTLHNFGGNCW